MSGGWNEVKSGIFHADILRQMEAVLEEEEGLWLQACHKTSTSKLGSSLLAWITGLLLFFLEVRLISGKFHPTIVISQFLPLEIVEQ